MSKDNPLMRVAVYIDGGARGNPGPAGVGVVVESFDDGVVLHESGAFLGKATNNVAEYRGLLAGLRSALALGATEVDVFSDSQLVVRQMSGEYRVKNSGLQPLYRQARELVEKFGGFTINHIGRDKNKKADKLANQAMDAKGDVGDAVIW